MTTPNPTHQMLLIEEKDDDGEYPLGDPAYLSLMVLIRYELGNEFLRFSLWLIVTLFYTVLIVLCAAFDRPGTPSGLPPPSC